MTPLRLMPAVLVGLEVPVVRAGAAAAQEVAREAQGVTAGGQAGVTVAAVAQEGELV